MPESDWKHLKEATLHQLKQEGRSPAPQYAHLFREGRKNPQENATARLREQVSLMANQRHDEHPLEGWDVVAECLTFYIPMEREERVVREGGGHKGLSIDGWLEEIGNSFKRAGKHVDMFYPDQGATHLLTPDPDIPGRKWLFVVRLIELARRGHAVAAFDRMDRLNFPAEHEDKFREKAIPFLVDRFGDWPEASRAALMREINDNPALSGGDGDEDS